MKKKILTVMLAGVMAAGMSAGSVQAATTEDASGDLYVFIAASLANAMDEIQKDFNEEYSDVNILFNADSSGTLQTQIEEGIEADVFMSAATKQMNALTEQGLVEKDSVVDLLQNQIVLITAADSTLDLQNFEDITKAKCDRNRRSGKCSGRTVFERSADQSGNLGYSVCKGKSRNQCYRSFKMGRRGQCRRRNRVCDRCSDYR